MIRTTVKDIRGKELWHGDLPSLSKGHRVNVSGESMKVMDSAITLWGSNSLDADHGVSQLVVVESSRD